MFQRRGNICITELLSEAFACEQVHADCPTTGCVFTANILVGRHCFVCLLLMQSTVIIGRLCSASSCAYSVLWLLYRPGQNNSGDDRCMRVYRCGGVVATSFRTWTTFPSLLILQLNRFVL